MHRLEEKSTTKEVVTAVIGYSLCSSTLLLANKAAMIHLGRPSVISFIQIVFASISLIIMKYVCGSDIDGFEMAKIKPYALYIVAFVSAIYANMRALAVSNVETVIVFRACTPLAVSIIDYFFMNRALPSLRSALSLVFVCVCAIIYCMSDSELMLKGFGAYTWVSIYFVIITFEMTYGKKLTSTVKMKSVWGPVLYCNVLATIPMLLLGLYAGDFDGAWEEFLSVSNVGMSIILFSCVTGLLIGYTGWLCRGMVSAASYTLVGVVNKFITVLLNVLMWNKHSTNIGLLAVCGCLVAGAFYEQAPLRSDYHKEDVTTVNSNLEERDKLIEISSPNSTKK